MELSVLLLSFKNSKKGVLTKEQIKGLTLYKQKVDKINGKVLVENE